jgi:hypothetical protein
VGPKEAENLSEYCGSAGGGMTLVPAAYEVNDFYVRGAHGGLSQSLVQFRRTMEQVASPPGSTTAKRKGYLGALKSGLTDVADQAALAMVM